jgi:glycosyltransferase involved in cell wall biosynthesis
MHIALVHDHVGGKAGGGGGVRLMLELGAGLHRRGHRITVACHDHLPSSEFADASHGLEIRAVRSGTAEHSGGRVALARRYWFDMPSVARLVPDDVDIVNAHEWPALRPSRIAAGRLSVPLVWTRNDESPWERATVPGQTIHGSPHPGRRVLQAALCWPDLLDARRAQSIVVLSQPQVAMVRRSYGRGAEVLGIGPPEQFFDPPDRLAARARLGIAPDTFLVLGSGILVTHRRFEALIEAISLLGDDPSVHLLLVGSDHVDPAYADRLTALVGELGLSERVTMSRRSVADAEIKDAYAAADVFVILSQRYAWGLAPLEAIASGTPVIISGSVGVHDILAGRPGVAVVPDGDGAGTAAAIRRWRSGGGRDGLESTRTWLREEYTIDRYVERMEAIYEAAMAARPSVARPARR